MAFSGRLGRGYMERIPLVLVLDISASMARPAGSPRIDELNTALRDWLTEAAADPGLHERLEIAIVTFDSQVRVLCLTEAPEPGGNWFAPVGAVQPPQLCASGLTLMLPAIETAINLATERTRELREQNIPSRRPLVWLVTDGAPSDEHGAPLTVGEVKSAGQRLREAAEPTEDGPGCLFYAIGVGGADLTMLDALAPSSSILLPDFSYRKILRLALDSASKQRPSDSAEDEYARTRNMADLRRRVRGLEDELM